MHLQRYPMVTVRQTQYLTLHFVQLIQEPCSRRDFQNIAKWEPLLDVQHVS